MSGRLIISLDFELHWGVFDHCEIDDPYITNLYGARKVIPEMLGLFNEHEISATWATVGFLFAKTREELELYSPKIKPQYCDEKLNPYSINIGKNEDDDPLHFANSLIDQIKETPRQEIATHTFSHYYTLEKGQYVEQFRADIQAAKQIANDQGISIESLVYPRNQFNEKYHEIAQQEGIQVFRGNQPFSIYSPNDYDSYNQWKNKILRLVDSLCSFNGSHVYSTSYTVSLTETKASFFLRPYSPKFPFLQNLCIRRIKKSMRNAAKVGGDVHLWWHPHNFGKNQTANLKALSEILSEFSKLRDQYGMRSMSMSEVADVADKIDE